MKNTVELRQVNLAKIKKGKKIVTFKQKTTDPKNLEAKDLEINEEKNDFKFEMKKGDWVFCNRKENKISEIEWQLYSLEREENGLKNVYDIYKKCPNKNIHFGLKMDKFTNIFNIKEDLINAKASLKLVHDNIDSILKTDYSTCEIIDLQANILDKLIVGLGGHSVFETDIKVHHTYGVPYIPASAVKGCLRNYIINEYFDGIEEAAEKDFNFIKIFGGIYEDEVYKGGVVFLDAFPLDNNIITVAKDIMTPHYDYANNNYRDDYLITPISFLVIKEVRFRFPIKIRTKMYIAEKGESKLEYTQNYLVQELSKMLENHGIGAKTSVGYGFFKDIQESNKIQKEINKKIEEIKLSEELKNLSPIEISLYHIDRIEEKQEKNRKIMDLYNVIDELSECEKEILAKYLKEYLSESGKWKLKGGKTENKNNDRIKKVCDILNCEEPI